MVTKWKTSRAIISFIAFVMGISLLLTGGGNLLGFLVNGNLRENLKELTENDYQNTERFRWYISDYLETFLTMAVNGPIGEQYENDDYGYSYSYSYSGNREIWRGNRMNTTVVSEAEPFSATEKMEAADSATKWNESAKQLHEEMKEDKNILYSISYDGELKYSNTGELKLDGPSGTLPEGYNFLLYFDGEKATIVKDGKKLDVYGNGYYSDDSAWYVPGYANFTVDEDARKATVCMAATKNPMIYVKGNYSEYGTSFQSNQLYWVQHKMEGRQQLFAGYGIALLAGAALLAFYVWRRADKKRADMAIARWTGRLWIEVKILAVLIGFLSLEAFSSSIRDIYYMIVYGEVDLQNLFYYIPEIGHSLVFFWLVYLFVNDLRYNKEPWKCSFCAFTDRVLCGNDMALPVQRRMVRRYSVVVGCEVTVACVILIACGAILFSSYYYFLNSPREALFWIFWGGCAAAVVSLPGLLLARRNRTLARDLGTIAEQVESIRGGNLSKPVTLSEDTDLRSISDSLNDIQRGMKAALDEQTKSERMKVELITNVSHDLKTPLTSIITYAELLREEEELPEHVKDYVRILNDKSRRLKGMVQDVFEVSKAASGQLPVDLETLDFGKLIRQTLADMEERIEASSVTIRASIPKEPVMIVADGQRLYRVFQNLIQNALQHSLDGSRVFISLTADGRMAQASVKNTSALEICSEMDFTERFVRGDQSRSDSGSGLGLSIARSFTEACGGHMRVEPIADLFIVTVEFSQFPRTRETAEHVDTLPKSSLGKTGVGEEAAPDGEMAESGQAAELAARPGGVAEELAAWPGGETAIAGGQEDEAEVTAGLEAEPEPSSGVASGSEPGEGPGPESESNQDCGRSLEIEPGKKPGPEAKSESEFKPE